MIGQTLLLWKIERKLNSWIQFFSLLDLQLDLFHRWMWLTAPSFIQVNDKGCNNRVTSKISVHQPENDLEQIAVGRSHSKMVSSSKNGNSYLWRLFPNSKECFNIENRIHSSIAPDKKIISRWSPVLATNAAQVAKFSVHQFMPHCEHPCEDNHRNRIPSDLRFCFRKWCLMDLDFRLCWTLTLNILLWWRHTYDVTSCTSN